MDFLFCLENESEHIIGSFVLRPIRRRMFMRQYGVKITMGDMDASVLFNEPAAENFVITGELKIFAPGVEPRVIKELETLVKDKEEMVEAFNMDPDDPHAEVIHELFQKGILQISKCYRDI